MISTCRHGLRGRERGRHPVGYIPYLVFQSLSRNKRRLHWRGLMKVANVVVVFSHWGDRCDFVHMLAPILMGQMENLHQYCTYIGSTNMVAPIYTVRPTRSCSSVPKLETGTPKLSARHRKSKNYSRVEFITRPTECPTQPRRMIDASRVYTFI